jgi:hypothetical protein
MEKKFQMALLITTVLYTIKDKKYCWWGED